MRVFRKGDHRGLMAVNQTLLGEFLYLFIGAKVEIRNKQ